jgi:hypothetical protein
MTDRDIVQRVAAAFGTRIQVHHKEIYRTAYSATVRGSHAVALMRRLRPWMGSRRRHAIDRAIAAYRAPERKLSPVRAEEIRRRHATGETMASLAREFDVSHPTMRAVVNARIYRDPGTAPWEQLGRLLPVPDPLESGLFPLELHWLAGWLEGEGSFLAPPPSAPKLPRISGHSKDLDVLEEIGCLLRIKPTFDRSHARHPGWSPTWRVLKKGTRAILLMRTVEPLMGERRKAQIQRAVAAADGT